MPIEQPSRSASCYAFLRSCDDQIHIEPWAPGRARASWFPANRMLCSASSGVDFHLRPRAAFASLKELAQGAEPGGLVLGQFDLGVALCRQVQQMALMAEMCDHREWSKKN